jgi:hypothetical protein
VSFTYTKWTREYRDATPSSFKDQFIRGSQVEGLPGQSPPAGIAPAVNPQTPQN